MTKFSTLGQIRLLAVDVVSGAERDPRPGWLADHTGIDDLADLSHRLQKARVLVHHEGNASGLRSLDDGDAILERRRERLLHDRREFSTRGERDQTCVRFHRRRDVNEVQQLARQHLGRVAVISSGLVAFSRNARLFEVDVTDCRKLDFVHARPCRKMIFGKEAAADQTDAKRRSAHAILLAAASGFRLRRAAPRAWPRC